MEENEIIITEKNIQNLSNNLNNLKKSIQEILKESQIFNNYLNSIIELIQKVFNSIESMKNKNNISYKNYINIENLYKDKLINEFDNIFKEIDKIYKMTNYSKELAIDIKLKINDSQTYENKSNIMENISYIYPSNSAEYHEKFSYLKKDNIQNDSNNNERSEKNSKISVDKLILIDENTKIRNNLLEAINSFKNCCDIIIDDSNISEFPVLNEFNNINKVVNYFYKLCQLIINNSINYEN